MVVSAAVALDALLVASPFVVPSTLGSAAAQGAARAGSASAVLPGAAAVLAVGLLASRGLYDFGHPRSWRSQSYAVMSSISMALIGCVLLAEFASIALAGWVVASAALAIPVVALIHVSVTRAYVAFVNTVAAAPRAIVVGADAAARDAAREFALRGYKVLGHVDNLADGLPGGLLGPIERLDDLVERLAVDEVIVAIPSERTAELRSVLTRGFARPIRVKYAADLGELRLPTRFDVRRIGRREYIDFAPVPPVGWTKRAMDIALAGSALIVLIPLFAAIALAIKVGSPGPVFYRQMRVGKDRELFWMLKFRSMRADAEARLGEVIAANEVTGPMFKIRKDPRVTSVGRILRRTSVDELPQLVNVLRGEMSLVGPRPPLASEVEKYQNWQIGRLRAVPGMTGLWQISGRTNLTFQEMVRLDLHYIRNWSLGLDLVILLRTIPAVISARGAY